MCTDKRGDNQAKCKIGDNEYQGNNVGIQQAATHGYLEEKMAQQQYETGLYQANYNTNSLAANLVFVIDPTLGVGNTLDDIEEGIINKHLTKSLKEKLINFEGSDYLTKAVYDTDDNGIVDEAENALKVNSLTVETAVPLNTSFTLTTELASLTTTDRSSLIAAINEVNTVTTTTDLITVTGAVDLDTIEADSVASKAITDNITVTAPVDLDDMSTVLLTKVDSDNSGDLGSTALTNILRITQIDYDSLTPDPTTVYFIVG